jgi:two-component system LytT family response regulator
MRKVNCIIIEDEPLATERLKGFVKRLSFLNLIETFDNAVDAISFLKSTTVDLIFLDLNMDQITGIQFLENNSFKGDVIITTAYDEYALKGFELNVTDYLLKPFTFDRFLKAVDKVQNNVVEIENKEKSDFLFVKTENRLEKVDLNDVLYIEGMGDYRRIHLSSKKIMTLQTFTEFEKLISSNVLCRVHKSYMVSISKIEAIERNRIKINEVSIPVSETYKSSFLKIINK